MCKEPIPKDNNFRKISVAYRIERYKMRKEERTSYLLSMIIPVYNAQNALRLLVESICLEPDERLEIILINDGSTDNSLDVAEKYRMFLPNLNVIDQSNHGAPYARNAGLHRARGKYLWFFDADDILGAHVVPCLLNLLKDSDADLIIGNMKFVDEKGRGRVRVPVFDDCLTDHVHPAFFWDSFPGNKIYRRRVIQKNGIFWSDVQIHQDLNFYLKFLPFCERIQYVSNVLYAHVEHTTGSISASCGAKIVDAVRAVGYVSNFYRKKGLAACFDKELEYNLVKHILIQAEKFPRMNLAVRLYAWLYFRGTLKRTPYQQNPYLSGQDKRRLEQFIRLGF